MQTHTHIHINLSWAVVYVSITDETNWGQEPELAPCLNGGLSHRGHSTWISDNTWKVAPELSEHG